MNPGGPLQLPACLHPARSLQPLHQLPLVMVGNFGTPMCHYSRPLL